MGVLLSTEGKAVLASGLAAALYFGYRAALPKPLPGIPYNRDAANRLLGDMPEMIGYVMRTKRIFVSHLLPHLSPLPLALTGLMSSTDLHGAKKRELEPAKRLTERPPLGHDDAVLAHVVDRAAPEPHRASVRQARVAAVGGGDGPARDPGHPAAAHQGL